MKRRVFSREFKVEAVKLIKERGVAVAQAARDLDVAESVLRRWAREGEADPKQAFPGHGQVKPEQQETDATASRGRQAEGGARHPKKSRGLLCQGVDMKFGFVAKHRGVWPVRWLCEALGVSRSGFHAWLSRPPSARAVADEALTARVRASFVASDRTYGARRVWHDVLAEGASCGLHRVERLMRAQALRARPRRRGLAGGPGRTVQRRDRGQRAGPPVRGQRAESEMGGRFHLHLDSRRLALRGGRDRPVFTPRGRLVDESRDDRPTGRPTR